MFLDSKSKKLGPKFQDIIFYDDLWGREAADPLFWEEETR